MTLAAAAPALRYTIVIPVLDQLHYTQQCVASLLSHGTDPGSILVIDNASRDDTPEWLASRPELRSVRNPVNLGCGGAWTQGALLSTASDWVVLLNNDIVTAHDMVRALLDAADRLELMVASPALVEGELDYDLDAFTQEFLRKMSGTVREAWFHGVCFAVRRQVFERIGFPDTDRMLFGREDAEFLARCKRHRLRVGTVGDALLHHFGSITQSAMKRELNVREFGDHRYLYAKLGLGWFGRQSAKWTRKARTRNWSRSERERTGLTLHMVHRNRAVEYR